jgi:uncharacterized protein
MKEKEAIALLHKYAPDEKALKSVLAHAKAVQKLAVKIANDILHTGFYVDVNFIKTASLLHDIGRFKCPPRSKDSIAHGVEGAEILLKEKLPKEALVCARHIGAGITKKEIIERKLPLPHEDYIPETIEEKIIAYADNLIDKDKEIKYKQALKEFEEISKEAVEMLKNLHDEIEELRKEKE